MRAGGPLPVAFLAAAVLCAPAGAGADVIRDGSVRPEIPAGKVPVVFNSDERIQEHLILWSLGDRRGDNLFHSFSEFDLDTVGKGASPIRDRATFFGRPGLKNIIVRVTGGPSSIDGIIRSTVVGADLFLINPAGLTFHDDAVLDVKGSFYTSSADYLRFKHNLRFESLPPPGKEVLSWESPEAFGFRGSPANEPAEIKLAGRTNRAGSLRVPDGEWFSVVGDEVSIEGENSLRNMWAPSGRIQIASVSLAGEIPLDLTGVDVDTLDPGALGTVALSDFAILDAEGDSGSDGGSIVIRAGRFVMKDGGRVKASTHGAVDNTTAIDVALTDGAPEEGIELSGGARLQAFAFEDGAGGDVRLRADLIRLGDGSLIEVKSLKSGASGDVHLDADVIELVADPKKPESLGGGIVAKTIAGGAGGAVELHANVIRVADRGIVAAQTEGKNKGAGAGGHISIETAVLELVGGGQITASTLGVGDSGGLDVFAPEGVEGVVLASGVVPGVGGEPQPSGLFARSRHVGRDGGRGGNLNLVTGELVIENGAEISARTSGEGDAGKLTVTADSVRVEGGPDGQAILSARGSSGLGGQLTIDVGTGTLEVLAAGEISASTVGEGNSGDLTVTAGSVLVSGTLGKNRSGIFANTNANQGEAGKGGNLVVEAMESVRVVDGAVISVLSRGTGQSGDLTIDAPFVEVARGGEVTARALGVDLSPLGKPPGEAGSITITAGDLVIDGGSLTTETKGSDGGDITLHVTHDVLLLEGAITTSVMDKLVGGALTGGDGGNISIDPERVVLRNGKIQANASVEIIDDGAPSVIGGNGGNIAIVTEFLLADTSSVIEASSDLGIDGTISVKAPDTNLMGQLGTLPEAPLDVTALLTSVCGAREARAGSFVVQRRGGLPPPLDAPLDGFYVGSGREARAPQAGEPLRRTQPARAPACLVGEAP